MYLMLRDSNETSKKERPMRILVSGVAGFLGSWLAEGLLQQGHEVLGVDNLIGGSLDNLSFRTDPGFTFWRFDINNLDAMMAACAGCQIVYHAAALAYEGLSVFSPRLVTHNIVSGSVTLATAAIANKVQRFINCSSMARYGDATVPYCEIYEPRPVDPYGMAKLAAEQQLTLLGRIHGMSVVHVVPHNIIGPHQKYDDPYRNVAAIMVNRVLQGKPVIVYGDGLQTRCFSFIQDVLDVLLQLVHEESLEHGEIFNIGPDENPITINRLVEELAVILDTKITVDYQPARPCETKIAYCSSAKIRRVFGYATKVSLREGLTALVDWIRQRGPKPFVYHLPIEINSPQVPETWRAETM